MYMHTATSVLEQCMLQWQRSGDSNYNGSSRESEYGSLDGVCVFPRGWLGDAWRASRGGGCSERKRKRTREREEGRGSGNGNGVAVVHVYIHVCMYV